MSGTMSDTDTTDMSAYEFSIACEWPDCDAPATVMGKGCVDNHYVSVCEAHEEYIRSWFDAVPPYILCAGCGTSMLVFEHHFHILAI